MQLEKLLRILEKIQKIDPEKINSRKDNSGKIINGLERKKRRILSLVRLIRILELQKLEKEKDARPTNYCFEYIYGSNISSLDCVIEKSTSSVHSSYEIKSYKTGKKGKEIVSEKKTKLYKAQFTTKNGRKVSYLKRKPIQKILNRNILSVPVRTIWDMKEEQKDSRIPDLENPVEMIYSTNNVEIEKDLVKKAGMKLRNRLGTMEYLTRNTVSLVPSDRLQKNLKPFERKPFDSLEKFFEEYRKENEEKEEKTDVSKLVKFFNERRNK